LWISRAITVKGDQERLRVDGCLERAVCTGVFGPENPVRDAFLEADKKFP
jgi:hypothetical protein